MRCRDDFDPHKQHVDKYTWKCTTAGLHRHDAPRAGSHRHVVRLRGRCRSRSGTIRSRITTSSTEQFPADFIAEGVDQTRGWFYSLLAIAAGLGDALPNNSDKQDAAPYRAVVVNDLVLDAENRKMSKSLGNTVEPWGVIERHGVDAVRLFLVGSSNVWLPRALRREGRWQSRRAASCAR